MLCEWNVQMKYALNIKFTSSGKVGLFLVEISCVGKDMELEGRASQMKHGAGCEERDGLRVLGVGRMVPVPLPA